MMSMSLYLLGKPGTSTSEAMSSALSKSEVMIEANSLEASFATPP